MLPRMRTRRRRWRRSFQSSICCSLDGEKKHLYATIYNNVEEE
jgi:hypothetical protein